MTDAMNRKGGVSDLMASHATGNRSCINSTSLSTTAVVASSTHPPTTSPVSRSKKLSAGFISGIVVGGTVGVAAFAALALLFRLWKRKRSSVQPGNHLIDIDGASEFSKVFAVLISLITLAQRAFRKILSFCLGWTHSHHQTLIGTRTHRPKNGPVRHRRRAISFIRLVQRPEQVPHRPSLLLCIPARLHREQGKAIQHQRAWAPLRGSLSTEMPEMLFMKLTRMRLRSSSFPRDMTTAENHYFPLRPQMVHHHRAILPYYHSVAT